MNALEQINAAKRAEVAARRRNRTLASVTAAAEAMPAARGFAHALTVRAAAGQAAVIAEAKKASPSKGLIRADFDPPAIARSYAAGGATCLSVLTDVAHFQGHDDFLVAARNAVTLPVLRKDFVVDEWQVPETRALGADAMLLIVASLDDAQLAAFHAEGVRLGLDVLVEVHDARELERALAIDPQLVGINNRNLKTFQTDIATSLALHQQVPDGTLCIAESGIRTRADVDRLRAAGIHAFLVGEAFMRAQDPGAELRALFDTPRA